MIRIASLTILPDQREVFVDDIPVTLGSRAIDLLIALAEREGQLVTKEELIERAWPTTCVAENSLHVQIAGIRKILGRHRNMLTSISGRGYRLACPVQLAGDALPLSNVPALRTALYGRETAVHRIIAMLRSFDLVTLVGAGGIGKTSVALEIMKSGVYPPDYRVHFVELARQEAPDSVASTIAGSMGLTSPCGRSAVQTVINQIPDDPMLLVLDNCEHVIDAVADFLCRVRLMKPACKVLATSREALRIPGEHLYQLGPLDVPEEGASEHSLLACSSVQLFLARAQAVDAQFSADSTTLELISLACQRLDGIPLAIELAAARAPLLGVDVLVGKIGERLDLLSGGPRNALPRHQTLRATFDWSYNLLGPVEQRALRRLGVLRGAFTLEEAHAVVAWEDLKFEETANAICALVSKSLVSAQAHGQRVRYRLLETTRSYAEQRLDQSGERDVAELRRAKYLCQLFRNINRNWTHEDVDTSLGYFRCRLDDARAALDWAFSTAKHASLGCELAALVSPRLFDLSLVRECGERASKALDSIDLATPAAPEPATLQLRCALASAVVYTAGAGVATLTMWNELLKLAIARDERSFEARSIWGLWNAMQYGGRPLEALGYATRFAAVAARDANLSNQILAQRIAAISEHYCGNHVRASELLESMLSTYVHPTHRRVAVGHGIHHGIVARATLARVLMVQGKIDHARAMVDDTLAMAREYDQAMVTSYVLVEAVLPVSALSGDIPAMRLAVGELHSLSARFGFEIWRACSTGYSRWEALNGYCNAISMERFQDAVATLRALDYLAPLTLLYGLTAQTLIAASKFPEALNTLATALSHCEQTGELWFYPELLRLKGGALCGYGAEPAMLAQAENTLMQAQALARKQSALLFELRAAIDLANLRIAQGRYRDAALEFGPVFARFPRNQSGTDWANACSTFRAIRSLSSPSAPLAAPQTTDIRSTQKQHDADETLSEWSTIGDLSRTAV